VIVRRPFVWLLSVCAAIAGCAALPSPSSASFGTHSLEASFEQARLAGTGSEVPGPPDLQAGSHPYQFTAKFAFNTAIDKQGETLPEGSVKDVRFELPRGVIGSPNALPQCPMSIFGSGGFLGLVGGRCPADTQVGTTVLDTTIGHLSLSVYNLVPPPGVAAQFGIVGLTPIALNVAIRSTSDYGLTVEIHDLSQVIPIRGVALTLWGIPAEAAHNSARNGCPSEGCPSAPLVPLLTMPTSCSEPLTTTIATDSWEAPGTFVGESATGKGTDGKPIDLSGCDRLAFDPAVAIRPESSAADTPTGMSIDVSLPYRNDPEGLAEAYVNDLSIVLPTGMSINPAAAGGLAGCLPTQIALGQASKPTCPDASKIGSVEIQTPLIPKILQGSIYLAQPPGNQFEGVVTVYLAGSGDGIDFKLTGQLDAQPGNGQLTLTLNNLPELPLSDVKLYLFGGQRAAIATPTTCATFTTTTELTPYSAPESGAPTTRSSSVAFDEGCSGGFAPSLRAGSTNPQAGQATAFALHLTRNDGQQHIQRITAALPSGLMANIGSISQCGAAEAAAGTCPASSEMGAVVVGAGAGSDPYDLDGKVYFTGPYGGSPFGLAMVIPAQAGPFALGTVLVRGGIAVDLAKGIVTIATDPFPTSLQGIPLRVKTLDLLINRPGFMVNPTGCTNQAINSVVSSVEGSEAGLSTPFRVTGCSGLPFAPKVTATTLAKASSRGDGASLDVRIANVAGHQMNLKSMVVELPRAFKARLTTVQQACLAAIFAVNPGMCPPASVVGNARIDTSLLSAPLAGPVYLVFRRGTKYPDLVLVLQGSGLQLQLVGSVNVNRGIASTAFTLLPDVPLGLFELNLPEGRYSVLGAVGRLCAKPRSVLYSVVGQAGTQSGGSATIAVEGCRARAARAARHRRGRVARRSPQGGRRT
jgi:hypothetical protein